MRCAWLWRSAARLRHQNAMAAADNLRMHGQTIHARADEIAQIIEITRP
jgi:hypothetical protein